VTSCDLDSSDDEDEEKDPSVKAVKRQSQDADKCNKPKTTNVMKDINNDARKLDNDKEAVLTGKAPGFNTKSDLVTRTRKTVAKTSATVKRSKATGHIALDELNAKTHMDVATAQ
jgi:DNA-directed RNA polymerase alpha subunit